MIVQLLHGARRLDETLKAVLGRPYHVVLGVGLTIEIIHRVHELIEAPARAGNTFRLVVVVVFCSLLLIHQLAELAGHQAGKSRR